MDFEERARICYINDEPEKLYKAISAGKQLDNSLKKEYGKEGATDCHFRMDQYIKYFSYESLGLRNNLINIK